MQEVRPRRKSLEATAKTTTLRKPSLTTPSAVYIADLEHHTTFLQKEVLRAKSRIATLGSLLVASLLLNAILLLLFFSEFSFSDGDFFPSRAVNQHTINEVLAGDKPLGDLAPHLWGPRDGFLMRGGEYSPFQNLTLKQLSWIFHDPWTRLGLNESNPTHPYTIFPKPMFGLFPNQAEARHRFFKKRGYYMESRHQLGPIDQESLDDYLRDMLLVPYKDKELCRGEAPLFKEGLCEQAVREIEGAAEILRVEETKNGWWTGSREKWYRGRMRNKTSRKIKNIYARGKEKMEELKAAAYTAVETGGSFVAEKLSEGFTGAAPAGTKYTVKAKRKAKQATETMAKMAADATEAVKEKMSG